MDGLLNQKLYAAVRKLYEELIAEFTADFPAAERQLEPFLSSFSYGFVNYQPHEERRRRLLEAALVPELRQQAEKTIEACYANCSGDDFELYLCDAIEDFLNYVIPRTIDLPTGLEIFEHYYSLFDASLYGPSCLVTVTAILRDLWDHRGGLSVLPVGFRTIWFMKGPARIVIPYTRERAVPFFEIKKRAHPIGIGRGLDDDATFLVLQYSAQLPKKPDLLGSAYELAHDVITKFLLAARIKTYSTAYSDYRGFRMLGRLSARSLDMMNYPDDRIEGGESRDVEESQGMAIDRLLTKLMPQKLEKFAVINQKIEDAMRRRRRAIFNDRLAQKMNEIDQLLDYFQILEAIVPAQGSEYIALYAARLLSRVDGPANEAYELYRFLKDMHSIRNEVVHGRVDKVLAGEEKIKRFDILRFRQVIYDLTCLYIMNGSLRESATRLALGEKIELEREYETNQADWLNRRKLGLLRNANTRFW